MTRDDLIMFLEEQLAGAKYILSGEGDNYDGADGARVVCEICDSVLEYLMYKDENGGDKPEKDDDRKGKLKEYKENLDRIEGNKGLVGSSDLNDDEIPVKPPPTE